MGLKTTYGLLQYKKAYFISLGILYDAEKPIFRLQMCKIGKLSNLRQKCAKASMEILFRA